MPSEKEPFYDPVPPTYDEALAAGSRRNPDEWLPPRDSVDDGIAAESESRTLLSRWTGPGSSSRAPRGYRAPTVETDGEEEDDQEEDDGGDSLWDSDSDADSAAHVRREMQEMDIEEPIRSRGSLWGKRIGFSLSLPQWKWWSWRPTVPRLPRLPRMRIQLPSEPPIEDDDDGADAQAATGVASSFRWPKVDGMLAVIVVARTLAVVIILGFAYLLFSSTLFGGMPNRFGAIRFNPEDLRVHLQSSIDPWRMRESVQHFAGYSHIAGTEGDFATAMDVESMFSRAGLDEVQVDEYYVYLNYPVKDGRAVQIMSGDEATWTAKLEEEERGDETAGRQPYAFHGHSKSGDVRGPLIYANYGSRDEYQRLKDEGINTEGAIALVRYYGTQTDRALKVKGAELAGFAGCIIYSDPADDGFLKGEVAPKGRYMPADGVQRGAVSLMSWVVGDVLTPGWASKKGVPRMKVEDTAGLVGIPSLPLSWRDAQVLLQHLEGYGQKVPDDWKGGVPEVKEWWTGNSSSPIVRLKNEQDENKQQPIWNVYGKIIGTEQTAKSIILGNHRDAWAFGATDPHTGTAITIELARIFGDLVSRGWRPLRTIEFMSWDAEEYNLIGSTEFVENNLETLRENAFAYINLDTVVVGSDLRVSGSPVFSKTLIHALDRVLDPNHNLTLKELWDRRGSELGGLGAGSDFVAFQDMAGTSSLDLGFAGDPFPYHSTYDNFQLMDEVIDPGFTYHALLAQVVGLILLDLADRAILPFDMAAYGRRLTGWVAELEHWAKGQGGTNLGFDELQDAAELVRSKTEQFEKWELDWDHLILTSGGWEENDVGLARLEYNNRMSDFETNLLDLQMGGGIPNRTQFKHVVFGPQLWSGYDEAFFPAIRDVIEAKDWGLARRTIAKTSAILRQAASVLVI